MKYATIGPVEMFPETLAIGARQVPYFRNEEFSNIMLENESMLLSLADASEGSKAIFMTCSGTGMMEAVVMNLIKKEDKVLVINGGSFGQRFVDLCELHEFDYECCSLNQEQFQPSQLASYKGKGFTVMMVNLHETSNGQLYPIECLQEFCTSENCLFIVDAISTFLCDQLSMKHSQIDCLIASSQKGCCCAPGISMAILSPRSLECVKTSHVKSLYFDFKPCLLNQVRGQTPFTPAVGILYEIHERLSTILAMGLSTYLQDINDRAMYFRSLLHEPCHLPSYSLSNALTPVVLPNDQAKQVLNALSDIGYIANPCSGELASKMIRIAHIGNLNLEDMKNMAECINQTMEL